MQICTHITGNDLIPIFVPLECAFCVIHSLSVRFLQFSTWLAYEGKDSFETAIPLSVNEALGLVLFYCKGVCRPKLGYIPSFIEMCKEMRIR